MAAQETRAERTKRKLAMLAGGGNFRMHPGSPDTSGNTIKPVDVAHAMSFIRQRRRDPESGSLSMRDAFRCRLSELLLTVLYVELGAPGASREALRGLLVARAEGIAGAWAGNGEHARLERMVDRLLYELTTPRLCVHCSGNAVVPEWRWQQLMNQGPDRTRRRLMDCPKCGGSGLKPRADRPRYEFIGTDRITYQARWREVFESLHDECQSALREGLRAIQAALLQC